MLSGAGWSRPPADAACAAEAISAPPPELAVVFQDYSRSLFPWLTVCGATCSSCRQRAAGGVPDKGGAARSAALAAVGSGRLRESHYTVAAVGGMQQRVAIAQALGHYQPKVP